MISRRTVTALAALALLRPWPLSAAPQAPDPRVVVTAFGDRMLSMLNEPQLSRPERERQFAALLDQYFDFAPIARFVLGRYWRTATDAEKAEFAPLFKAYVVKSYATRFDEFKGTTFNVLGVFAESDTSTIVHTTVMRPGGSAPSKVDWRVTKEGHDYKITEVSVEGVSMSLTHRDEFAAYIERNGGGVAALIAELRRKTA